MSDRSPGRGRYAHLEREQRWIVRTIPHGVTPVAEIFDRYIHGTQLRLRWSENADGVVLKLGQKVRAEPADPETVSLTNIYLSEAEYHVLLALPAAELYKTRSRVQWRDHTAVVDVFHGHLDGLVLAEVELSADEPLLAQPPWAVADVTSDNRFSGGALAFAAHGTIAALLK